MTTETPQKLFTPQDIPLLKAEIIRLATKYPDFVYRPPSAATILGVLSGCSNLSGGDERYPDCKGCIVGQAVQNLGFTIDPIYNRTPALGLLRSLGLEIQSLHCELSWFTYVQIDQDKGCTWGQAIQLSK